MSNKPSEQDIEGVRRDRLSRLSEASLRRNAASKLGSAR